MTTPQPIQTRYKNRLFRSRLEARWAVFFETLGFYWEYEREGFDIDGTYYLPDFYLQHLDLWIEIKPKGEDEWPKHFVFEYFEKRRGNLLEVDTPFKFILLSGQPIVDPGGIRFDPDTRQWWGWEYGYVGRIFCDTYYYWCECQKCGFIGIEFEGRSERLSCNCFPNDDKGYNTFSPRLLSAYRMAMEARFERNS
jgi:hypothetical protein